MPARISILYSVFCIKVRRLAKRNTKYNIQDTKYCKASGFTLIELLIVITIIGILATVVLASFGGAQAKARDGRRKSDLAQVKRAMELAKSDCKGSAYYPSPSGGTTVEKYNDLASYLSNKNLAYMSTVPKDPKDSFPQQYEFQGSTPDLDKCPDTDIADGDSLDYPGVTDYAIWVVLERTSDSDAADSRDVCNNNKPTEDPANPNWTDASYAGYYVICNN